MGRDLSSAFKCSQPKSFRASAVDALSATALRADQALVSHGLRRANPAHGAPDRSVEVHDETKPRRRGAVTRRAEAKRRRRVSALHGDGSTWPSRRPSARAAGLPRRWDGASLWLGGLPPITLYPVGALAPVHNPACTGCEARDGPDQSLPRGFCSQGQGRSRVPSRTRRTADETVRFLGLRRASRPLPRE